MKKTTFGAKSMLCPIPIVLFGANVDGKPNYNTLGNCGIMALDPPTIYVSSFKEHYTNKGASENGTFSVNTPSVDFVVEADYCGIASGKTADKSRVFDSFYGVLKTAPMASQCPINVECELVETLSIGSMDVFVGRVAQTYVDEKCITNGEPDIEKIQPLIYSMDSKYWRIGEFVAESFSVGKGYSKG